MTAAPWDGLVPEEDLASLLARGQPLERAVRFGARPALLVVDMTRAFVEDGYPTSCTRWGSGEAAEESAVLLAAARRHDVPVYFTRLLDNGPGPRARRAEQGRRGDDISQLFEVPPGLPDGNVVADAVAPLGSEIVFGKPSASAFFGSPLDGYLTFHSTDTVVVVGLVTSGCVRATVVDAWMRNCHVLVPRRCVADYSDWQHRTSLLDMHVKYADVCEVDDAVACFEAAKR